MKASKNRRGVCGLAGMALFLSAAHSATAQECVFNATSLEFKHLSATVYTPIHTTVPGSTVVKVRLPFEGAASYGSAICEYRAVSGIAPRIQLRCNRIIPQGCAGLRVESEFYGEDGLAGISALRAPNGSHFTTTGGQLGKLLVTRLVAIER